MKITALMVLKCNPEGSDPVILANASDVCGYSQSSSVKEFIVIVGRTVAKRNPPGQHQSVQHEEYKVHSYNRNGLCALGFMDDHYPVRSAFSLLNKVLDEYLKKFGESWKSVQSDYAQPWPYLDEALAKFQDPAEADKLFKIQEELDETKIILKALAQANDAKVEGNTLFKDGLYEEALSKYEFALQVAADIPSSTEIRSICHANRAACFSKLGKHEETIKECTKALELNPTYIKALVRRAEAHEKLEHYDEAITDMSKILELEPSHYEARRSVMHLKPLAEEKREKMKEEMIGKLKEMGNSILGRFGMSIDNFKAVKDPNTGSYSVSFQK